MFPQLVSRTLETILTVLILYTFEYLLSLLLRSEPQLQSIVKNELRSHTVVSHIALAPTKASKIAKRVIWAQTLNIGN